MPYLEPEQIPAAVCWHDGMLLTPEHLQQLNLRQEYLLQHHVSSIPFNWGISKLAVDETALSQGRFALLELEGVLPDGLTLHVKSGSSNLPVLALDALDASFRRQPFYIFLAVMTVARSGAADLHLRYMELCEPQSAYISKPDDEEDESLIPRLGPRLHLIASVDSVSEQYVSIPLVRLVFRNGAFVVSKEYLHPVRQISIESRLGEQCGATLQRLRDLALFMHDRWKAMSAEERAGNLQVQPAFISSMTAGLPVAQALLRSNCAHPFSLYLSFCAIAGSLTRLSFDPVAPVFSPYQHNDIVAAFAEVDSYINKVLSEIDTNEYLGVPMKFEHGAFIVKFLPEWIHRRLILAARASTESDSGVIAWGESALIGSSSLQEGMRERRVLGSNRSHLETEQGLFAGPGVVLFHLANDREYIIADEVLEVSGGYPRADVSTPVEMTLYIRQSA